MNSTIYLTIKIVSDVLGTIEIAGHSSKVKEEFVPMNPKELKTQEDVEKFHIRNCGKLIELNE